MADLYDEDYSIYRDEPDEAREDHYWKYGCYPPPAYQVRDEEELAAKGTKEHE